jgi:hypothetical protein
VLGAGLGHAPRRQDQAQDDDRDVHQEHRAPAGAPEVGRHQDAAEDLPGDHRQAGRGAVQAHGPGPAGPGGGRLDGGEDLRQHRGGRRALRDPRRHQRPGARRETAGQRGQAEGRHAAEEEAAPAEQVAEPPAQDEQDGVREPVPGDDQLQHGLARVQVPADRRQGDVDDEEVDERECRCQQHGEESEAVERGRRHRGSDGA